MDSEFVTGGSYSNGEFSISVVNAIKKTKYLSIVEVPIAELERNLHNDCWGYVFDQHRIVIIPNEVISTQQPKDHYLRILNADLSYPIIVYRDLAGLQVVDGMHRLCKAKMLGNKTIKAKITTCEHLKNSNYICDAFIVYCIIIVIYIIYVYFKN